MTTGDVPTVSGEAAALAREVLSEPLKDVVGLLGGDWIGEKRKRNKARLGEETERLLKDRGSAVDAEKISLKQIGPILVEAQDEGRPELQDLWARLLAAALDPSRAYRVRKEFIETVKQLDTLDALVLEQYKDAVTWPNKPADKFAVHFKRNPDEIEIALERLGELNCLKSNPNSVKFSARDVQGLTPFGRELLRALYS